MGRAAELAALQLKRLADGKAIGGGELGLRLDLAWRLADREAAPRVLHGALEAAPGDAAVLDAGVALAFRFGRDRDAAPALERLADASDDDDTRAALGKRRPARAIAPAAGRGPRRCRSGTGSSRRARPTRRCRPSVGGRARGRLGAGHLGAAPAGRVGADGLSRAVLLWDLGGARQAAGDSGGADADFARALEADATFLPALRAQARLREATGDGRAAAELYAREARLTKAPARAAAAFRQAARLYANQVRDDAMAGRCLEEVLAIEPEAETDFEVLQVILRARNEDDWLAQVMRRRAAAGTLPKRRDRLLALAELIYARDPVEAAAVLAEAVKLDPTSVPVLLRLAEVEAELGRSAEAIATYRQRHRGLGRSAHGERRLGSGGRHRRARAGRRRSGGRGLSQRAPGRARRAVGAGGAGARTHPAARLRRGGDRPAAAGDGRGRSPRRASVTW